MNPEKKFNKLLNVLDKKFAEKIRRLESRRLAKGRAAKAKAKKMIQQVAGKLEDQLRQIDFEYDLKADQLYENKDKAIDKILAERKRISTGKL